MTISLKCEYCGERTMGHTGLCRTCKSANHHGHKRVKAENLIVDLAGGSWWIWDPKGRVLIIGQSIKRNAFVALHRDPVDEDDETLKPKDDEGEDEMAL